MKRFISTVLLFFITISPTLSRAGLVDKGGGLIYDSTQNITWTKTADPMGVNFVHPKDGLTIPEFNTKLASFTYAGFSGWRLPTGPIDTTNLTGGEFYNLWVEVGATEPSGLHKGPFTQVTGGWYWTGTASGPGYNFIFDWGMGIYPGGSNINTQDLAIWLVHDGELTYSTGGDDGDNNGDGDDNNAPVPEPGSMIMLAAGAGLLGCKRIRR